jgi:ubiquinone/menaquinone biosynthesis C-methylase UbiE
MRMFLRRSSVGRDPLAVAMSGVRMGERLLQVGMDDPAIAAALAAKPGLSGESTIVVTDDATAVAVRRAIGETGALVTVRVHTLDSLPFGERAFDVAVVHDRTGRLGGVENAGKRVLQECLRVIRAGGRVVVLERGAPSGLAKLLARKDIERHGHTDDTVRGLETAGFRAVRVLGDRDNYRFVEGMKLK